MLCFSDLILTRINQKSRHCGRTRNHITRINLCRGGILPPAYVTLPSLRAYPQSPWLYMYHILRGLRVRPAMTLEGLA